jgi:hypothetical protein
LRPSEECLREVQQLRQEQARAYLRLIHNPILLD